MRKIDAHLGKFILCDLAIVFLVLMSIIALIGGHLLTYLFVVLVIVIVSFVGLYQKAMLIGKILKN